MSASDVDADLRLQIRQWQHDLKSPLSALEVITDCLKRKGAREAEVLEATLQHLKFLSHETPPTDENSLQLLDKKLTLVALPLALRNLFLQKQTEYISRPEVQLSFNSLLELTVRISVYSSDFQRMISNLINNSLEAIEGPGWVRVNLWQEGYWVVIQVVDSGCGIPESLCEQVLECGFSYGKDSGSGLGLWQARQVVERAGGEIKIDSKTYSKNYSKTQGGATIQIKLPSLS